MTTQQTVQVIELLKNADKAIHEAYPVEDSQQSIAKLAIETIEELEKQVEFKIKECQELAQACNRYKNLALK